MTIDTSDELLAPEPLEIKLFRQRLGWSATRLGQELGISRSYIKHLESETDPWPVRPKIAIRFRALQKRVYRASRWKAKDRVTLFSKFKMPSQLVVLTRPRLCAGHRRYCVFKVHNQRFCNRECERLYRGRKRKRHHA